MNLVVVAVLIALGLILCASVALLMVGFLIWRFVGWIAEHALRWL